MTQAVLPLTTPSSALTIADLNTSVNHEARVEDVRLAEALGMERPREIRGLIERHKEALERLGAICVTVTQNTDSKGRGRPGRTYWLTKRQALYICTKSETERATEATIQMVEVFDEYLKGTLAPPKPVQVRSYRRALPRPAQALMDLRPNVSTVWVDGHPVPVRADDFKVPLGTLAVVSDFDGKLLVDRVTAVDGAPWYGRRSVALENSPGQRFWILGSVVAA